MSQSSRRRDCGQGRGVLILRITTSGYWALGSPSLGSHLQEPKGPNFWVGLKFGFVQSLGLFELWVCSKFGFVRSSFKAWVCSTPPILGSIYDLSINKKSCKAIGYFYGLARGGGVEAKLPR